MDYPNFPNVTYRRGAFGSLSSVLRGTGIWVQTFVNAAQNNTPAEMAEDYDLPQTQVQEALGFYEIHRAEIDAHIQAEAALEPKNE